MSPADTVIKYMNCRGRTQMLWSLSGVAAIAASVALLKAFSPRQGQVVKRSEWLDISVAIVITTGIGMGTMLLLAGLVPAKP